MQSLAVSRTHAVVAVAVVLCALVLGGKLLTPSRGAGTEPTAVTLESTRAEPRPQLVVHVVGAVRRPGLYRLREGNRISDAVRRAGGATPRADLALVNLAAPLADGTQVVVPARAPAGAAGAPGTGAPAPAGPLHLNTATAEQLDELPGVGPVTAEKIVAYREKHGAFSSVDELDAIPGIGPARLEQLRELVAP